MKNTIQQLTHYDQLSKEEAFQLLVEISEGMYNPSSIAVLLTVFMMRPITVAELEGFRDALLELCKKVDFGGVETIDLCGTGGDGKNTFNISTLASFVVASCGIPVSKHGNSGVSSVSGSSNVLESLGVKFSADNDFLKRTLDEAGICFLHAPLFHPAMKNVAPIRKDLGVKTFFNMLGPMINPAFPRNQLVGVYDLELMRMYSYLYQKGEKNYTILHSFSGHDEISLTTDAKFISNQKEGVLSPSDFGANQVLDEEIFGGNSQKEASEIFVKIISGKGSEAQNHVVAANAGLAVSMVKGVSIKEGFELAKENLLNSKAKMALDKLIKITND
ncbi:anthranilate phosphoribosyltransferase [Moheibacter lacus]|uniref:Anthranilate phosphoribosyltransferase n=1 Tax=Moheibacter lacus TaxID=2745851 RepID=A0A838ZLQ0_9FLAO|nr:anthranilate phosphoribosyltransferase [Moheibacter lacus]MBA5628680.1 anthranilate phosphoribosyltransferase [Moheibacter lacus]